MLPTFSIQITKTNLPTSSSPISKFASCDQFLPSEGYLMSIILTRIQTYTITLNLIVIINTESSHFVDKRDSFLPRNLIAEYIASQYRAITGTSYECCGHHLWFLSWDWTQFLVVLGQESLHNNKCNISGSSLNLCSFAHFFTTILAMQFIWCCSI